MSPAPARGRTRKTEEEAAHASTTAPAKEERTAPPARAERMQRMRENWRLLVAGALLVLGAVIIMLGWYGTAYTNIFTEQIPYLVSGGLLGLGLLIVAGLLGVSELQAREIRELRKDLNRALSAVAAGGGSAGGAARRSGNGQVYVVPGGRSFHLPGCPLLEGKDGEAYAPARALEAGYTACKLCGPD
jgi:uncharacterized integral membrane protein